MDDRLWRSLAALEGDPAFLDRAAQEFSGLAQVLAVPTDRRRVMKLMAASLGAADPIAQAASLGAADPIAQAASLGLYDPDRSTGIVQRRQPSSWNAFLKALADRRPALKATRDEDCGS